MWCGVEMEVEVCSGRGEQLRAGAAMASWGWKRNCQKLLTALAVMVVVVVDCAAGARV
jgi:hypothetical protein